MPDPTVWVKFKQDYHCCWKQGTVAEVSAQFAYAVIEAGYAKAVDAPKRHKAILHAPGMK